ncbi:MAG: AbrB/MazE/SpoVT family DNA-binding domain-containing protein [Bacteroidales bacterium]|nr:AbrB/MazE/SpoVT family DNA-binding domain-containing protein [Bacteroidales bacterium]
MEKHEDKYMFGVVKVGDKGQIVIPKDARVQYGINPGDTLMLLGDQNGMAMVKTELFASLVGQIVDDITK